MVDRNNGSENIDGRNLLIQTLFCLYIRSRQRIAFAQLVERISPWMRFRSPAVGLCSGRGTRKRAAAHALLVRGTGIFRVNGNEEGNCFRLLAEIERTYERISGFKVQVWC